jgi:para-nitrobenzyl esterase
VDGVIEVQGGRVRGVHRHDHWSFSGIPYAASPAGTARFRPPAPPRPWTGLRPADRFGPVAPQAPSLIDVSLGGKPEGQSEDCLHLNIWTPALDGARRPVMVWIHGGSFVGGSGSGGLYRGGTLARDGDVVVVTLNYRLGLLGFLAHPVLASDGQSWLDGEAWSGFGNWGLADQVAALRWVRDHVAEFGGDPGNVTIFGESAGGVSVLAHLVSPASAGLFHRAILQSCSAVSMLELPTLDDAGAIGQELAAAAGLGQQTAQGLRALTTKEIMDADGMAAAPLGVTRFHVGLTADGEIIPEPIGRLLAAGRFHRVPVINGTNRDEFTWFAGSLELATKQVITAEGYADTLGYLLGTFKSHMLVGTEVPASAMPEVLARYPLTDFPSPSRALSAVVGDCGFVTAGGRLTSRLLQRYAPAVYAYEWDVPDSHVAWPPASFPYGSGHVQEVQYLFPRFAGGCGTPGDLTPGQAGLADQMVQYWTSFAHSGTPNARPGSLPEWDQYDPAADNVMELCVDGPRMASGFGQRHHSDFWDQFFPLSEPFRSPQAS